MIHNLTLSLMLDGLIVVLLIATIIYVARLSVYLKRFKDSRSELESIVKELSTHITKADKSISTLNETVEISSDDIQKQIDKAAAMADELDIIVQTGDALANRLEDLAVRNRRIMDGGDGDAEDLAKMTKKSISDYDQRLEKIVKKVKGRGDDVDSEPVSSIFSIRDREIEDGNGDESHGFTLDDDEVLSDAERDLYKALQTRKKPEARAK
jgi:exonuclease VII small subunit